MKYEHNSYQRRPIFMQCVVSFFCLVIKIIGLVVLKKVMLFYIIIIIIIIIIKFCIVK